MHRLQPAYHKSAPSLLQLITAYYICIVIITYNDTITKNEDIIYLVATYVYTYIQTYAYMYVCLTHCTYVATYS